MGKTYYVKITGDKDKIEDMLGSISFDYQFDKDINIGELKEDIYELVVEKEFNKYSQFNSLEPLFKNIEEEKIKDCIYDLIRKPDLFSKLCEFRDKEVYGVDSKYE